MNNCVRYIASLPETFPDPVTGGVNIQPVLVLEGSRMIRGRLPGVYSPLHAAPFADLAIVSGLPGLEGGATCVAKRHRARTGYGGGRGQVLFQTDGDWL